jgi:hypothetical protein
MDNPHHKYEDASNTWSEIDWTKIPDAPTFTNEVEISSTKLHRLYASSDKYDYAMLLAGRCKRLAYCSTCGCDDECKLLNMHMKWEENNG